MSKWWNRTVNEEKRQETGKDGNKFAWKADLKVQNLPKEILQSLNNSIKILF